MKKTKKLSVLLMSIVLVFSVFTFAACGGVKVSDVTLNKTEITLLDGETFDLAATVEPEEAKNKNVTWSSDDTAVATVSSAGKVTAVGKGIAIITAATEDGVKATCGVTVKLKNELAFALEQVYGPEETVIGLGTDLWERGGYDKASLEFNIIRSRKDDGSIKTVGKVVIKDATTIIDYRLAFLAGGSPLWQYMFFPQPVVSGDAEAAFYFRSGKIVIESADVVIDAGDDGDKDSAISFTVTTNGDGSISLSSNIGLFSISVTDRLTIENIEQDLGTLLVEVAETAPVAGAQSKGTGTFSFYDSGILAVSDVEIQLPMDFFIVEYTYSGGVLTIANGSTIAMFMGNPFSQVVKFEIADGDAGAKVITIKFHNGGSETDVRTAIFTITATQLALLA